MNATSLEERYTVILQRISISLPNPAAKLLVTFQFRGYTFECKSNHRAMKEVLFNEKIDLGLEMKEKANALTTNRNIQIENSKDSNKHNKNAIFLEVFLAYSKSKNKSIGYCEIDLEKNKSSSILPLEFILNKSYEYKTKVYLSIQLCIPEQNESPNFKKNFNPEISEENHFDSIEPTTKAKKNFGRSLTPNPMTSSKRESYIFILVSLILKVNNIILLISFINKFLFFIDSNHQVMAIGLAYLSDIFHHKTPSKGLSKSLLDIQTDDLPYWNEGRTEKKHNNNEKTPKNQSSSQNSRSEISKPNEENNIKMDEKILTDYLELNYSQDLDEKSKSFEIHDNENRKKALQRNKQTKKPLKSERKEIKNTPSSENNSSDKFEPSEADNKVTYCDTILNKKQKNILESEKKSANDQKAIIFERFLNDPKVILTRCESNNNEDLEIHSNSDKRNDLFYEEGGNKELKLSEKDEKDPIVSNRKNQIKQSYDISDLQAGKLQFNKDNIDLKTEEALQRKSEDHELLLGKLVQSRITNISDDYKKEESFKIRREDLKQEEQDHKNLDSEEIIHFTSIHSNEIDFNEYDDGHKIISRQFSKEEEKNLDILPKNIYDSDILFSSGFNQKDEKINEYFVSENLYHSPEILTNRKEKMKRAINVSDLDPVFYSPILNAAENNLTSSSNNNNLCKLLTNLDNQNEKKIIQNDRSNAIEIEEHHIQIERIPFPKEKITKATYQDKFEKEIKDQSEQILPSSFFAKEKIVNCVEEIKVGSFNDSPEYQTLIHKNNETIKKTEQNLRDSSQNEILKIGGSETLPPKEKIKLISMNTSRDITSNSNVSSDDKNSISSSDKQLSSTECIDTRKFSAEFAFNNENMDFLSKEIEKLKQLISLTDNQNDELKLKMLESEKEKYLLEKEVLNLQQMLIEKNKTLTQKEAILSKLINDYELTDHILKSKYQEKEKLFNQKIEKSERKSSAFSYKRQLMAELAEKTNLSRALLSRKTDDLEATNKQIEVQNSQYKELQKLYKTKIEQLEHLAQETDKLLELPEKIRIEEERDHMKRELISKDEKILELEKKKEEMETSVCYSKNVTAKIIDAAFECMDDKLMEEFEGYVFQN